MTDSLVVNEVYLSLQGESTFAGLPCVFVRLTACNLRCSYCDTAYAFTEGKKIAVMDVRAEVRRLGEPFRGRRISLTPGLSAASRIEETAKAVATALTANTGLKPDVNA